MLYKIKKLKDNYIKIEALLKTIIDLLIFPFTAISCLTLKFVRLFGLEQKFFNSRVFNSIGIFPILDHYYEPLFNRSKITYLQKKNINLMGLNWNDQDQILLLSKFRYNEELASFPEKKRSKYEFSYDGGSFNRIDSCILYNIIRHYKPSKIIEIGSGKSTLMSLNAIRKNTQEKSTNRCKLYCIEPFKQNWLENTEAIVIRKRVEEVEIDFFEQLKKNDILFIDSTHILNPFGDVHYVYAEILPSLRSGVIIHSHDIFLPFNYPLEKNPDSRFWNEQYLLEVLLRNTDKFKVILATNYLANYFPKELLDKCPMQNKLEKISSGHYSGSFWYVKN